MSPNATKTNKTRCGMSNEERRLKCANSFIKKASIAHNNKYDYSKVEYITARQKVCIICPEHGEFWQTPDSHLRGNGCPLCQRVGVPNFIKRAQSIHGNKYDYSKITSLPSLNEKVPIRCHIHGVFILRAGHHLEGRGCPLCAINNHKSPVNGKGVHDVDGDYNSAALRRWYGIMARTDSMCQKQEYPSYKGVSVCDEWLLFSNFKQWLENPANGFLPGYHVDKDLLVKGNRIYSPDTCCLLPPEINTMLTLQHRKNKDLPLGVTRARYSSSRYIAVYRRVRLGTFDTPEDAFLAYKHAKESHIKNVAKSYFLNNKITQKVYEALMNYSIDINDGLSVKYSMLACIN